MKVLTEFTYGTAKYNFEFEGEKDMEALNKAITLSNPPRYCGHCGNNQYFQLDTNKDKDANIYVNALCKNKDCYAKAKLGQYKSGGYFWHKFEKYEGKTENGNQSEEKATK